MEKEPLVTRKALHHDQKKEEKRTQQSQKHSMWNKRLNMIIIVLCLILLGLIYLVFTW